MMPGMTGLENPPKIKEVSHHSRHHGDQERGGEHHEQGHRVEDRRPPERFLGTPTRCCHRSRRTYTSSSWSPSRPRPTTARISGVSAPRSNGRHVPGTGARDLPQAPLPGRSSCRIHGPEHQGGAFLPAPTGGQTRVLLVRTPQLLVNRINRRSDETPRHVTHAHALAHLFPWPTRTPKTTLLLGSDNFRSDQVARHLVDAARLLRRGRTTYCAMPALTATQYARANPAGLMPLAIDKLMPNKWLNGQRGRAARTRRGGVSAPPDDSRTASQYKLPRSTSSVRPEQGRNLVDNIQKVHDGDFHGRSAHKLPSTSSRTPALRRTSSANRTEDDAASVH